MAELELINHTKKALKSWISAKSVWHKIRETIFEISIIVFAVTLSISLHSWSEHRHQQKEVTSFLTDLNDNLEQDIGSLKQGSILLQKEKSKLDTLVHSDSTAHVYKIGLNTKQALLNIADFEGFLLSGKIGLIENKKLKKEILEYYRTYVPLFEEQGKENEEQLAQLQNILRSPSASTEHLRTYRFEIHRFKNAIEEGVAWHDLTKERAEALLKKIKEELR